MAAMVAALALLAPASAFGVATVHEHDAADLSSDARSGSIAPSAPQRDAVRAMGARAQWNRFGTPSSLIREGGWLAQGLGGTPRDAAREFLRRNASLFRLSEADVAALDVVNDATLTGSDAHAVLFRQRFGGLPATGAGSVVVGVRGGDVAYAAASLGAPSALRGEARLTPQEAWAKAAHSVGERAAAADVSVRGVRGGFGRLEVRGLRAEQQVRQVAVPTPRDGVRRAFEANVVDNGSEPSAYTVLVDAESGAVLRRVNRLDNLADEPRWKYFTNNPPVDGSGTDRRVLACLPLDDAAPQAGCEFDERATDAATPAPWDVLGGAGTPTFTTNGNNADTALSVFSPLTPGPDRGIRPASVTRDYVAPFTNAWQQAKCNPSVFVDAPEPTGGTNANDVNAAIYNLFAQHNNMHDWAYDLGFTEANFNMQVNNFGKGGDGNDPEPGDAQGGALTGGAPTFTGRDNANQITLQDGVAPITNMYLWQPIASAFYPPCVDGDYDMSVIGHEYTHAISNRMVAGPDDGLTSNGDGQARAMGESFSDLTAVEYLAEHGYAPSDDENPFAVGAYVTGSKQKGIRNYGMNESPLNFSGVQGYDGSGMGSPHDDGEIWSAANYDIRQALVAKHGAGDAALQLQCARGEKTADQCPGNRRWMQIVFDAYLLMPPDGQVSMLEARDAYLAADRMRFGGANQGELWTAFARRGMGESAASPDPTPANDGADFGDTDNPDPAPGFDSPLRTDEGSLTFKPATLDEGNAAVKGELFVGEYEANVTPVADTNPATPLGDTVKLVPGTYSFVVRADGHGLQKFTREVVASSNVNLNVAMPTNRASAAKGATISGDGGNLGFLVDDTEESNWVAENTASGSDDSIAGSQVTVRLAGGAQTVERVQVSALLRAVDEGDAQDPAGNQNRFTALRQFEIQACNGTCADDGDFTSIYTSPADAFPGNVPRPLAPDMILRSFDVPDTQATHVRMVVLSNQCTGFAMFSDPALEEDPGSSSDCTEDNGTTSDADDFVRASELEVLSRQANVTTTDRPAESGATATAAQPAAPGTPAAPAACASTAGFRSVGAAPRGRGLRISLDRRVNSPVSVDVFQQSRGRRVVDNRLVARFRDRTSGFTWTGRSLPGRALNNGQYFVRFRMPTGAGRGDVRRITVARSGGLFRARPPFYGRNSCGLVTSYKLSSSVFGGAQGRRLGIAFRVSVPVRATVTVRRGARVIRRFAARDYAAARTHRLSLAAGGLPLGDYRVTLEARRGTTVARQALVARRL